LKQSILEKKPLEVTGRAHLIFEDSFVIKPALLNEFLGAWTASEYGMVFPDYTGRRSRHEWV
jgi:hypothetical protein